MSDELGPREAVSLKRAAYLLDVHEDTIRRWWKDGKILVIRVGPKLLRVPRSEIAKLRKAGAVHPNTSA